MIDFWFDKTILTQGINTCFSGAFSRITGSSSADAVCSVVMEMNLLAAVIKPMEVVGRLVCAG